MWPLNLTQPFVLRQETKAWLTKHTQLCIGIYDSVVILCRALVHPWVVKRQATEPHLFPLQLWKITVWIYNIIILHFTILKPFTFYYQAKSILNLRRTVGEKTIRFCDWERISLMIYPATNITQPPLLCCHYCPWFSRGYFSGLTSVVSAGTHSVTTGTFFQHDVYPQC